jgi:hypothetical protein
VAQNGGGLSGMINPRRATVALKILSRGNIRDIFPDGRTDGKG